MKQQFEFGKGGNPLGSTGLIIGLIVLVVALFFLAQGVFWLLSKLAIGLFVLALLIDYTVVTDYAKFLWKLTKQNPLFGILGLILTVVGYPVVSGFLFAKALMKRQLKKVLGPIAEQARKEEEFTEFEVIEEEVLELPEIETEKPTQQSNNEYDNLFE